MMFKRNKTEIKREGVRKGERGSKRARGKHRKRG